MGRYNAPLVTVIDVILHALSDSMPERIAAGHHGNIGSHMFVGTDPKTSEVFKNQETMLGGWGAMCDMDGSGPYKTYIHGDTQNVPIELQESAYPLRIEQMSLRPDSAGAGMYRGGVGLIKVYLALAPCRLTVGFDRVKCPPWGLRGGGTGQPSEIEIRRANGTVERPLKGDHALEAGDFVIVRTAGGGGYGLAIDRDVAQVALDVAQGYVSQEAARLSYGVVLDEHAQADLAATAQLRAQMRSLAPVSA
jgi:N-methylhydantoinase B